MYMRQCFQKCAGESFSGCKRIVKAACPVTFRPVSDSQGEEYATERSAPRHPIFAVCSGIHRNGRGRLRSNRAPPSERRIPLQAESALRKRPDRRPANRKSYVLWPGRSAGAADAFKRDKTRTCSASSCYLANAAGNRDAWAELVDRPMPRPFL